MIEAVLLGTGTSVGVPFLGCDCPVCTSTNPRNQRLRCSLLLRSGEQQIVVDCGPDFRQQALRAGLRRLDAVVVSHPHADHMFGLDDLRLFILHQREPMPIWATPATLEVVQRVFAYAFADNPGGSFTPRFELCPIEDAHAPLRIAGLDLQPFKVDHSDVQTLGFRLQDFAYISDAKAIPDRAKAMLQNLDVLIIDGLRHRPHRTHLNLEESLAVIAELRPKEAWLTHLTHDFDDAVDNAHLPDNVRLAWDGLSFTID